MHEVTVVVPTHNRCALLPRALRSVLAQRDVDLDVVVVDDGSIDGTLDAVSAFSDPRIRFVRHDQARGVSAARNRGIEEAAGEWIAFLDDDDLWAPDKLARQLAVARTTGRTWSYGGASLVTADLRILAAGPPPSPEEVVRMLPFRNVVPAGASNVVVRADTLARVGRFDTDLRHMSDWDLWIRLSLMSAPAAVEVPVVAYVIHSGNASSETWDIPREFRILADRYAGLRAGAPADEAYVYRWIALNALRSGNRSIAIRAYTRAVLAGDALSAARAVLGFIYPGAFEPWVRRQSHPASEATVAAWLPQQLPDSP